MSDFSDRPFVAGSLIGIRSFKPIGERLFAPVQRHPAWVPGENVAECRRPLMFSVMPPVEALDHRAGSMGCRCGFYAYFDLGSNPHHQLGNVLGLIEGYGVTTVGTRGFRCEKARIVALIAPEPPDFDLGFVFASYPDVPVFQSVQAAVAEFPLTVPEGTPETPPGLDVQISVSASSFAQQMKAMQDAVTAMAKQASLSIEKLAEALRASQVVPEEPPITVRERALWLRQHRNTGPAVRRGLDGRTRRQ